MKKIILFAVIACFIPISAQTHPGKTDRYGGHKCAKECEEWKLYYSEYHLHDKDGKPIRIEKKPKFRKKPELKSVATETVTPLVAEVSQSTQTVTIYQYVTTVREDDSLSVNPLLWVLLVLFLLLLIYRKNRKKEEH